MSVRILDLREVTQPIASPITNAYIDFSRMILSLVAVVTDAVRDVRRVVGSKRRRAQARLSTSPTTSSFSRPGIRRPAHTN